MDTTHRDTRSDLVPLPLPYRVRGVIVDNTWYFALRDLGGNEMTAMEVTARQSLPDVNINQTIRQHRAVSIPKPYRREA